MPRMQSFDQTIELIRAVSGKMGAAKFARLAGVPYTTVKDVERPAYRWRQLETFAKLADAAEANRSVLDEPPTKDAA